jgi:hypothetical protein
LLREGGGGLYEPPLIRSPSQLIQPSARKYIMHDDNDSSGGGSSMAAAAATTVTTTMTIGEEVELAETQLNKN